MAKPRKRKAGASSRRPAGDVLAELMAAADQEDGDGAPDAGAGEPWDGEDGDQGETETGETPAERRRRYLEDAGAGAEFEQDVSCANETVSGLTVLDRTIDAAARLARTAKSEAVRLRALTVCYDLQMQAQAAKAQTDVNIELKMFLARLKESKPLVGAPADAARQGGS
jgi:hypothetical protein